MSALQSSLQALQSSYAKLDPTACASDVISLKRALIAAPMSTPADVVLARDALELMALVCIRCACADKEPATDQESPHIAAFERCLTQLKPFYYDRTWGPTIPESSLCAPLLGLNLLRLLCQNRIGDFHSEVELVPASIDPHLSSFTVYPLSLEQYSMEGSYRKVLQLLQSPPSQGDATIVQGYAYFARRLVETVREEIASCYDVACASMPLPTLSSLLQLAPNEDVRRFAEKKGRVVDALVAPPLVLFPAPEPENNKVPALDLIRLSLSYAKELERIV